MKETCTIISSPSDQECCGLNPGAKHLFWEVYTRFESQYWRVSSINARGMSRKEVLTWLLLMQVLADCCRGKRREPIQRPSCDYWHRVHPASIHYFGCRNRIWLPRFEPIPVPPPLSAPAGWIVCSDCRLWRRQISCSWAEFWERRILHALIIVMSSSMQPEDCHFFKRVPWNVSLECIVSREKCNHS